MKTYSIVISLLFSSLLIVSSLESSFADEIISVGIGFEDSAILELKNSRGNTANIDTVRIWLSGDNEFKTFKTEQGWMGKNTPQGVIIFSSQIVVNPGDSVKFGIKTVEQNPVINWKALDSEGNVISSASTSIMNSENQVSKPELNEPKIITIKDESNFRFIPEKPAANSDFRILGDNFVPNQNLDFYIGDKLEKSIKVDDDGKILFTATTPSILNDERTEFILRDSGGNEKKISIRIPESINREIADVIKLSLSNTPQQVKRGDIITLEGMATPNTTLTITSKHPNGDILAIDTILVGFDGRWSYDNLISPEVDLGQLSIEIDDGKSKALRNIEVISAKLINISTLETKYEPGDTVSFQGSAIPNSEMSVILEDSIGAEIFSRTVSVGDTGNVEFNIEIPRGSIEGTYVLLSYQNDEEGVTVFGVGQEPQPILIVRPSQLNFAAGQDAEITIQGPANAQVALILIDSADREKFSDSINLGPDGKEDYFIKTDDLPTGAFTLNADRGESSGSATFTIGLTTGSGSISVQTTRDEYKQGDHILILGNTGSINVLLDITITDSSGKVIKRIDTFSDRFGVFKIDNFRIPSDAESGIWKINAKSGGNFKETEFKVTGDNQGIVIKTLKTNYNPNELIEINGSGANPSTMVIFKILDSEGEKVGELETRSTDTGEFQTYWKIPREFELGEYEITADDGKTNSSINFSVN